MTERVAVRACVCRARLLGSASGFPPKEQRSRTNGGDDEGARERATAVAEREVGAGQTKTNRKKRGKGAFFFRGVGLVVVGGRGSAAATTACCVPRVAWRRWREADEGGRAREGEAFFWPPSEGVGGKRGARWRLGLPGAGGEGRSVSTGGRKRSSVSGAVVWVVGFVRLCVGCWREGFFERRG